MARGRITYNSVNIDFDNGWNQFDISNEVNGSVARSSSGIRETVTFYDQDFIQGRIEHLKPHQQTEIDSFYAYARDGSAFTLERDRDLGTYINFKGWNATASNRLVTNDETAITFTRTNTTDATSYVDPSTGLVTFVNTANRARFPAGRWGQSGILIEPTRTNLISRSESFNNAAWNKGGVGDTTFADDTTTVLDPSGANGASLVTVGASPGNIVFTTATAISTNESVFSIWARSVTTGTAAITITIRNDVTETTYATTVINPTPVWTRYELDATNSGTDAENWEVLLDFSSSTVDMWLWGAQLEAGANILHATQYIRADAGSTVTRPAEEIDEISSTDVMNQTQGTVAFWIKPQWTLAEMPRADLFYSYNTTGGTWRHLSIFILTNGDIEVRMDRANSATQGAAGGVSLPSLTKNTWSHVVVTYDTTIANGLLTYVNGALVDTSTNNAFTPCDIGSFSIGSSNGSNPASAVFDDFVIRKNIVDASWVNRVYNLGRGLGERRNRWSSVQLSDPNNSPKWKIGDRYDLVLRCEEVLT